MLSTADRLKKKKQEVNDRAMGRQNAYKWVLPSTEIRILPTWRADDHEDPTFYHDFGTTWIKDMDKNVLATVADRKITFGEDDIVRNLIGKALATAKTDAQRKFYKDMYASARVLVNGLVLNDKNVDPNVPQILDFSEGQFSGPITDLIVAAEKEGDNILSLTEGFNMTVNKTGAGMDTRYGFTLARRASAVDASVMDKINDIDAFIRAKFADSERAVNALKSMLGESEHLQLTDRSSDLTSGSRKTITKDVVDADYNVLDEATDDTPLETGTSDADIDALFDND